MYLKWSFILKKLPATANYLYLRMVAAFVPVSSPFGDDKNPALAGVFFFSLEYFGRD